MFLIFSFFLSALPVYYVLTLFFASFPFLIPTIPSFLIHFAKLIPRPNIMSTPAPKAAQGDAKHLYTIVGKFCIYLWRDHVEKESRQDIILTPFF